MSANNDYFVKFDSNATAWAKNLETQLEPARKAVVSIQRALAGLETKSSSSAQAVRNNLAQIAGQQAGGTPQAGGGAGGKSMAVEVGALKTAIYDQAEALSVVNADLARTATRLKLAGDSIDSIPAKLANVMRSISSSINNITAQQTKYHAPDARNRMVAAGTPGAIAYGSSESHVLGVVQRAVKEGLSLSGGLAGRVSPTAMPAPAIGTIRRSDIDKANFDRVVLAIRAQTRVLSQGIQVRQVDQIIEAPKNTVSPAAPRPTASRDDSRASISTAGAETSVDSLEDRTKVLAATISRVKAELAETGADIKKIIALTGDNIDEGVRDALASLRGAESKMKAQLASMERELTGVTRGEQSAERRADSAAERAARPVITDVDKAQREHLASLIASPADVDDFDSRLKTARSKTSENYSMDDLREMAAAFREVGIAVRENTKTKKGELAERLKAASVQYRQTYPEGAPQLQTTGALVQKTTRISPETASILGDINGLVAERAAARELTAIDRLTGGDKYEPYKGRRGFGAAIIGDEVPTPFARTGSPADVRAAYATLGPQLADGMERAMKLAARPDFNPFDPEISRGIQYGSTPEEKDKGFAASSRLRDIRQATLELDSLGEQFFTLKQALAESRAFIERATSRIERGVAKPDDESNLATAYENVAANEARVNALRERTGGLLETEDYRRGYEQRNVPTVPFLSQSDQYRNAVEASSSATRTLSDARQLHSATASTIAGLKTVAGSQQMKKDIPGLTYNGGIYGREGGLSREDSEKLNNAATQVTNAQIQRAKVAEGVLKGSRTTEELAQAEAKLENAANKFANRIERMFNGIAPSIETFTGGKSVFTDEDTAPFYSEATLADEARRQANRDLAEANRTRKFEDSPKAASERANLTLELAEKRLADALENRASIQERAAALEAKLAAAIPDTTQREQALGRWSQADRDAYSKQLTVNRLESARSMIEDPANYGAGAKINLGADEAHMKGPLATVANTIEAFDASIADMTRLQGEVAKRDTHGYDASLGYNKPASDERLDQDILLAKSLRSQMVEAQKVAGDGNITQAIERLTAELQQDLSTRRSIANDAGLKEKDLNELDELTRQSGAAEREIEQLADAVTTARSAASQAEKAIDSKSQAERKESGETKKVIADTNGRIAALRAEQAELRKSGPYTRAQTSELYQAGGREDPEYLAARARRDRLRAINAELGELTGGGRGGGGNVPPTSTGGVDDGGPGDRNILNQILAQLKAIHTTLRGGVKVNGRVEDRATELGGAPTTRTTTSRASTASLAELQAAGVVPGGSNSADDRLAAMEAQRRRQARLRPSDVDKAHIAALEEQARRQQDVTSASAAAERQLREQARAQDELADATSRVSSDTQREIAELRRLTEAANKATTAEARLEAQQKIAGQQARVAGSLNADLQSQGVYAADRRGAVRTILNDAGPQVDTGELDSILKSARNNPEFQRVGRGWGEDMGDGTLDGFATVFGGRTGFWSRVMNTTGTFVVRNFAAGFVFGLTNALQQVMTQAIQAEATFIRVSAALEATGKDVGSIRSDLQGVASEYGVQLNDVYNQAAGLAGLFDNAEQLAAGTRIASQLQIISGGAVNATEATGILASTLSAFEAMPGQDMTDKLLPGGIEGVQHVADVLTSIQNNLGTNIEITAEGVSRMAGLARQMELSFEQTAVFTGQIAKQTNQTGAAAGEQFSRILAGLQTGRGRGAAVDAFGPVLEGQLAGGDYGAVIETMIAGWDGLTDAQRRNLTTTIAGQRQAASFNALMNNGTKTLNALTKAQNSAGAATDRMDKLVDTLNNRLARLGTNAQVLASNLIQTGILNFFGLVLVATNETLEMVNALLNAFNKFADGNGFLAFMRDAVTLLIGAGLAFKLVQSGVNGVRGAMRSAQATNVGAGMMAPWQRGTGPTSPPGSTPGSRNLRDAPSYSTWRGAGPAAGAPISRAVGFGLDRTLGVGIQATTSATARGLTALNSKLAPTSQEVGRFRQSLATFSTRMATGIGGAGMLTRAGIQQIGRGGLIAGNVGRMASGMNSYAERQAARAQAMRYTYAAQQRYASTNSFGQGYLRDQMTRQGMSSAEISQRTSAPDARLLRSADSLERVGRVAGAASAGTARLSGAMSRMAASGGLADGAMIGLTVGLTALFTSLQRHSQISRELEAGFEASFGGQGGGPKSQAEQQAEYVGPNFENLQKNFTDALEHDNAFELGLKGLGAKFTNGWRGFFDQQYALTREFGTTYDASETYGLTGAQDEVDRTMKTLANTNNTSGEMIRSVQEASNERLYRMAVEITENKNLSDAQKQAGLANIEQARKAIADTAENLAATADGLASAGALTGEQISRLRDAVTTFQATSGQGAIGGLDLTPLYTQLISDVGLTDGSRTQRMLERLGSGTTDSIDMAVINSKLLKEQVQQLYNQWQSKLNQGLTEEADEVRGQLMSVVAEFAQSSEGITDAITASAEMVAAQQSATGNFEGAMNTYSSAMNRADRQYRRMNRQVAAAFQETQIAYQNIAASAAALEQLFGEGLGGSELAGLLGSPIIGAKVEKPALPENLIPKGGYDPNDAIYGEGGALEGFGAPLSYQEAQGEANANSGKSKEQVQKHEAKMVAFFRAQAEMALFMATREITLQIARATDPAVRAALENQKAIIESDLANSWNRGEGAGGISDKLAKKWGDAAYNAQDMLDIQVNTISAQNAYAEAQQTAADEAAAEAEAQAEQAKADAAEARANKAALAQARLGVSSAYAEARGDSVAAARIQVAMGKAAMAAAKAELAAATTAAETAQARIAMLNAQAQIIGAMAAVQSAQTDLVQSQYEVSIALAEAAGKTVLTAERQLAAARAALRSALKRSKGKGTAEVNAARAEAIRAEAQLRDVRLQDDLDTIDFNLQMGKITQSSAINALQEILRTRELTREQRRQLLLQIKGMKEEMADSQWNFGDIKLPTPYQMRRYIEERKRNLRSEVDAAAARSTMSSGNTNAGFGGGNVSNSTTSTVNNVKINIDGADIAQVKKIIKDVVGGRVDTRTTGARRGR